MNRPQLFQKRAILSLIILDQFDFHVLDELRFLIVCVLKELYLRQLWANFNLLAFKTKPNLVRIKPKSGRLIALDEEDHLSVFGFDDDIFQLGPNRLSERATHNTFCEIENIVAIACGASHSIFLNAEGDVYACGVGSKGQLGCGTQGVIEKVHLLSTEEIWNQLAFYQANISKVVAIACALTSSLILNKYGEVYSCGTSLGFNDDINRFVFTKVEELCDIVMISCGFSFAFVVNEEGKVFSCGANIKLNFGQLAREDEDLNSFKKVISPVGIVALSCGCNHTFLIDYKGDPYSVGVNKQGQLGLGDYEEHRKSFTKVNVENVVAVECNTLHTFLLNEDGNLFVCGLSTYSRFGNALTCSHSFVEVNLTLKIISVGFIYSNLVELDEEGNLYSVSHVNDAGPGESLLSRTFRFMKIGRV